MGLSHKIKMYQNWIKWKRVRGNNYTSLFSDIDLSKISVGDYTYGRLNITSFHNINEKLSIGRFCSISSTSKFLLGGGHNMASVSTYPFMQKFSGVDYQEEKNSIQIDDDVWIGDSALIMSGVHIGQGAVVGAGAVVTKDIPPYAVVAGVPAKIIKYRFDEDIIHDLLTLDYSKLDHQKVMENMDLFVEKVDRSNIEKIKELFEKESILK